MRGSVDHAIVPIVHRALSDVDGIPDLVRQDLSRGTEQNTRRNLELTGKLLVVLRRLRAAGIDAVPWKGPALAQRAYGDLSLRTFFDLDLLVRRADLPSARDLLVADGFRPEKPMTERQQRTYVDHQGELELVRDDDGLWVELHWAVVPTYYAPPRHAGDYWGRLTSVELGRASVLALDLADDLEALCIHGSKHRWERLLWIVDIAMSVGTHPEIDWDALLARARGHGTLRMVHLGLLLAASVGGGSVPAPIIERALRDAGAVTLHGEVRRTLFAPRASRSDPFLFHARMRERGRDRARYILSALYTPSGADWERAALPPGLFPLYGLVRPFRLAVKYGRRLVDSA